MFSQFLGEINRICTICDSRLEYKQPVLHQLAVHRCCKFDVHFKCGVGLSVLRRQLNKLCRGRSARQPCFYRLTKIVARHRAEERSRRPRFLAANTFADHALDAAVGGEVDLGFAVPGVESRRRHRHLDQSAILTGHKQGVAALQIIRQIADRRELIGRIENEQTAELRMLDDRR